MDYELVDAPYGYQFSQKRRAGWMQMQNVSQLLSHITYLIWDNSCETYSETLELDYLGIVKFRSEKL